MNVPRGLSHSSSTLSAVGILNGFLENLDADAGRRGKQFEHICKWFLTNDPIYCRELRRPWLWDEWPGRWGADAGIDLVAEDHGGRLWAIQAKAYDLAYSITKADVDTFLSESARSVFAFRLLSGCRWQPPRRSPCCPSTRSG